MANQNDPRYVKLVQEFSDDPEFIGFSDEDQDSILDTAFQKRYGEIPKTENLLQRAIKSYQYVPSVSRYAPSNLEEVKDVGRIGSSIITPFTPSSLSENISEATGQPQFSEPRTEYGKRLHGDIGLGSLGALGVGLGSMASKFGGKLFGTKALKSELGSIPALEQEAIKNVESIYGTKTPYIPRVGKVGTEIQKRTAYQKGLGGIKEVIGSRKGKLAEAFKSRTKEISSEIDKHVSSGSETAQGRIDDLLSEANAIFGEELASIKSSMTGNDLATTLNNRLMKEGVVSGKGNLVRRILTPSEQSLVSLRDELVDIGTKNLKTADVQALLRTRLPKDIRLRTVVNRDIVESLPETVPGLAELKASHKPVFDKAERIGAITKQNLRRVATGKVPTEELQALKTAEKEAGIDVVSKAESLGQMRNQLAKEFKLKLDDLGELEDKKVTAIYNKMRDSKIKQSRLIHEAKDQIESIKIGAKGKENLLKEQIGKVHRRRIIASILGGYAASKLGIGKSLLGVLYRE